jgi:hypothetical protein
MSITLEGRVKRLEDAMNKITQLLELNLELSDTLGADPFDYARDDLDRKIIDYLLTVKVATSTEIKKACNITEISRQAVGKRLQRMQRESDKLGVQWLEYNPKHIEKHFRAWWLIEHAVKPKVLKRYKKEEENEEEEER